VAAEVPAHGCHHPAQARPSDPRRPAGRAPRPPTTSRRLVDVQAPSGKSVSSGCRAWPRARPCRRSRRRGEATRAAARRRTRCAIVSSE